LAATTPSRPRAGATPPAAGGGRALSPPPRARLSLRAEGTIEESSEEAALLLGPEAVPGASLAQLFPACSAELGRAMAAAPARAFAIAPLGGRAGRALALACWPAGNAWEAEVLPLEGGSGRDAAVLSELLHDLRTPLTTLLGASELLCCGRLGAVTERMQALLGAAGAAAAQITEILDRAAARRDAPPERGDA
jgi:signal transduction histidine kinase